MDDHLFIGIIRDYYRLNRRTFVWRERPDPYWVLVSEIMLQQTQTTRVAEIFPRFVERFPDFASLAQADLPAVLSAWQGLGYNRRGRFLKETAEIIMRDWQGVLPADESSLRTLSGIGPNTAASILAFAFNIPTVFIETNIRSVFLHHYFPDSGAPDKDLLPLVARTVDHDQPRDWYYALMDYGVFLKKTVGNANQRSPHYARQSRFEGSVRQVRGQIIKKLLSQTAGQTLFTKDSLSIRIRSDLTEVEQSILNDFEPRYEKALQGLLTEGLVQEAEGQYFIPL